MKPLSSRRINFIAWVVVISTTAFLIGLALVPYQKERTDRWAPCITTLREIEVAKELWATANNKSTSDWVTLQDLTPYLKKNFKWACQRNGTIEMGTNLLDAARCSVHGDYENFRPK